MELDLAENQRFLLLINKGDVSRNQIDQLLGEPLQSCLNPSEKKAACCILLTIDPEAPGVLSEFRTSGQAIRFGAHPQHLLQNKSLRAEFQTLIERLCYRHDLTAIYYEDEAFADLLKPAADRLGLALTTWQGHAI